jgi:acyl-CoA reductase-like NAD-dependent aldehyde dehydrogenase
MIIDNDLLSMQQARILAENAAEAQKRLAAFSQDALDRIVEGVADAVAGHAQALAVMSQEETDFGRWQDKALKNRFVCEQVRERLRGMRCVGVIAEDRASGIVDIGVPMGVIAALCPATSPVSTTIHTTLLAIKSGNAVLFSPHPRARRSIVTALDIMIGAAHRLGLPEGCLGYLSTVTKSGTRELMAHAATSLILITGVPGMLPAAQAAGKPLIYGGSGNGPVFIERTADIAQAVRDVVTSKMFDNGIAASAEQAVVVDAPVAAEVRRALEAHGAYFMSDDESYRLGGLFTAHGRPNACLVGLPATVLARRAGFAVPERTGVLVAERSFVSGSDPYAREMLAPILTFYVEDDWMHACEKCIELLLHERSAHTLVVHSRDEAVIRQFALKKPVGRLLVNTPATFGGMGLTTNLFPSMTLGSGSAGQGITSDNVSPMNLVYVRKVGYGVRRLTAAGGTIPCDKTTADGYGTAPRAHQASDVEALQQILNKAIQVLERPADN